jgi:hypothetical protein
VKRRLSVIASLICVVGGLAYAQPPLPAPPPAQPASPPGPPKIAVLIITGQHGHNWRGTTPLLRKALEDTGKFEVRVTEEFRGAGPETLAPYDLVVLNYGRRSRAAVGERRMQRFWTTCAPARAWWSTISRWPRSTGGPSKVIRRELRPDNGHHSAPHNRRGHRIRASIARAEARSADEYELYASLRWQPAGSCRVLATANDDHALTPPAGPIRGRRSRWSDRVRTADAGRPEYGRAASFTAGRRRTVQTAAFDDLRTRRQWAATGR